MRADSMPAKAIATAVRLCGPHALSARSWPTSTSTVWVAVLLGAVAVSLKALLQYRDG